MPPTPPTEPRLLSKLLWFSAAASHRHLKLPAQQGLAQQVRSRLTQDGSPQSTAACSAREGRRWDDTERAGQCRVSAMAAGSKKPARQRCTRKNMGTSVRWSTPDAPGVGGLRRALMPPMHVLPQFYVLPTCACTNMSCRMLVAR